MRQGATQAEQQRQTHFFDADREERDGERSLRGETVVRFVQFSQLAAANSLRVSRRAGSGIVGGLLQSAAVRVPEFERQVDAGQFTELID